MIAALLVAMAGCGAAGDPVRSADAPPVEGLELVVGTDDRAVWLTAAGAWLDEGGDGRGVDVGARLPGPPPLTITGERSRWQLAEGRLVFEGDVIATRGEVRMHADRLEVVHGPERIDEVTATGGVRVERGRRVATAETARLTVADGRVVLEGRPRVREGPNELAGERVVLFLDDERLECERCRLVVRGDAAAPR